MLNDIWKFIARFCARPVIAEWLIHQSFKTPYAHITGQYKTGWQFPISIRIHHIQRADYDRHLHDHPWNARTIIIWGGYIEERANGKFFMRYAGDTATLKFGEYHRIVEVSDEGAWTIFITGKYRGTWGFMVDGVKIPHKEYLK